MIKNNFTDKPFTLEEIMDVIKYMNGAYVGKDGASVKYINDLWIEFIVAISSDYYLIEDVVYKTNITGVGQEAVIEHENILENLDLSLLQMGDSSTHPFMKWFAEKINAMYTTTSKEEAAKIYREAYEAITSLVEGNGFVIDGVRYTINDFDNTNDLALTVMVFASQELFGYLVPEDGYVYDKEFVGIDYVALRRVLESFNPMCSDDVIAELEENGLDPYPTNMEAAETAVNYGSVMQRNAMADALANGEYGIEYYQKKFINQAEPGMTLIKD